MARVYEKIIVSFLFLFLLWGSLGLKNRADCYGTNNTEQRLLRDSELIPCLHIAAVSAAYSWDLEYDSKNPDNAEGLCAEIYDSIGMKPEHANDDIRKKAEVERNLCYSDIAKIIARIPGQAGEADRICGLIDQEEYGTVLTGASTTQEICKKHVIEIAKIQPDVYAKSPNNICSIIFILPVILIGALVLGRK
jgi:hypothetical protein